MNPIKIETYKEQHKNQIIELILKIQTEEFTIPITLADQPDLLEIPSFYIKNNGNFWVALENEKVVGTIALVDIGNSQCALRKMFVAKEHRGKDKQIAKLLLATLLEQSKINKVNEIYLGTISVFYAAHRFYEKNGFLEIPKNDLPKKFPVMPKDNKFYVYRFEE